MPAQKLKVFTVTVTTAGTRQRVVTDAASIYRRVRNALFTAAHGNGGDIYIGDSAVASTIYAMRLEAGQSVSAGGDGVSKHPGDENNFIDLYNTYVDTSNNGDKVHVSVSVWEDA